jgi:hypothetical protein
MPNSPLDFQSTNSFRQRLVTRNLAPYPKSPRRLSPPYNFEIIQSNYSVIDSPDQLIDTPLLANTLFVLNQYGSTGGYRQTIDPNRLLNTNSNEGEYGVQDADIIREAGPAANGPNGWRRLNPYGSGALSLIDSATDIASLDIVRLNSGRGANSQPYPTTFVPSFYSPLSILLSNNPTGTNGSLSQDSYLAKLAAKSLRKDFNDRVARQINRQTIGRANILNANSGVDLLALVTGTVPILEPNYSITLPRNPISFAAQFTLGLAGSTLPTSVIPGSYFDPSINSGQPTTTQQLQNAYSNTKSQTTLGQVVSTILGSGGKTGSQIFLDNTGPGQKSRLFSNIDYNKYKPNYDKNVVGSLVNILLNTGNNSEYYVGSVTSEPSRVFSPSGAIPVNEFNQEIQAPVLGPQELSQLYEGITEQIKLGANGPTYSNGGGIEGGFTWVSPKYKNNAGYKVGVGGDIIKQDTDFKESAYLSTESVNNDFRTGSILDDTQRLINSQPQGGKRLQHVGNAIDQVSKVFHDGYKEMTKGSKVLSYIGDIGQEKGAEYCRVFSKDTPYLQYNDLQKTDGMTTEGRKFSYSVLDKTYNLNIGPNKMEGGQDSTNLIGGTGNNGHVKKYMFSLENLAWRTSNKPGFTYSDLPICERGPNGGRIMWFPPYDLKFNENVSAGWNTTEFLGRPEPVYTYKSTSRGGTISWKIVVDHPSALNVIVNRVLAKETNKQRIDSILDSFFAGCRKYDLYELAKKYYTVNPNDLFEIQKELQAGETVTKERITYVKGEVGTSTQTNTKSTTTIVTVDGSSLTTKYVNNQIGLYFGNDYPKIGNVGDYTQEYNRYTDDDNKKLYAKKNSASPSFFENVVTSHYKFITTDFIADIEKLLSDTTKTGNISIYISGGASAPAKKEYNILLSQRRVESFKKLLQNTSLSKYINRTLFLVDDSFEGESTQPFTYDETTKKFNAGATYVCTDDDNSDGSTPNETVFSIKAMACRRAYISRIDVNLQEPKIEKTPTTTQIPVDPGINKKTTQETTTTPPTEITRTVFKDNITKRVLRQLLSECDYFETIKEETPMVYDNLREKLKFFNPAFHSTTPEGLNSRLTFLQQCLRPGDTIPVVRTVDGKDQLQFNNATNTSFGTPPVLVLRVGDFYHTKIIPDSLSLTYDGLDINPEGLGVQPMIATVSLNFKFIGGQGLASAVDKLQNALSFNYYGNTEMYDDRSDVTDKSYKVLDKQFLDFFNITLPPPTTNQAQNTNNNGQSNNSTIGTVTSTVNSSSATTGNINYQSIMDKFVDDTQNYFIATFNKNKEVFKQYNNAVRQIWTLDRDYQDGIIIQNTSDIVKLFGKPSNVEDKFGKISKDFVNSIDSGTEGLITYLSETSKNFSTKVIRKVKENYSNYVKSKSVTALSGLFNIIQEYTILQQSYVYDISKLNTITYKPAGFAMDGLQQSNGNVVIYITSGTTNVDPSSTPKPADTYDEIINDLTTGKTTINEFNTLISSDIIFNSYTGRLIYDKNSIPSGSIFKPFTSIPEMSNDTSLQRCYFLLNDDIVDSIKYSNFKTAIIGDILKNPTLFGTSNTDLEAQFDAYWINGVGNIKTIFDDENSITNSFLDFVENNTLKNYLSTPIFIKGKKREFTYTTDESANGQSTYNKQRQLLIKSLGISSNKKTTKNTWNDLIDAVYIGKVKFN